MTPGLRHLISNERFTHFLERDWPHTPFAVHDLGESMRQLNQLPFLASLPAMAAAWPHPVQAHLPDLADESSAVDVVSVDALKLFENKMSLLFNNVERISPVLKTWIEAIRIELALPAMTYGRCLVYATPDGKGTAPHFDQNINFVLQISGTKTWRLWPNQHVVHPTVRHTLGQTTDPELAAYNDLPFPQSLPELLASQKPREVVLRPGSLLFVPRGFWHSTVGLSDERDLSKGGALALNFTFDQPTWTDLLLAALKSRLTLSPEWRELADGVSSQNHDRRKQAENRFDQLLMELADDLPNWRAEDILGATEGF